MLNRIRLAFALLGLSAVVACGGTVTVDPGGAAGAGAGSGAAPPGGSPGTGGASAPASKGGSGNTGNVGSVPGDAPGSSGSGGEAAQGGEGGEGGEGGASGSCVVNGVAHAIGEPFACDCNTCWCEADGSVSTTLIACNECNYAGKSYDFGEKFPSRDGCNQCECQFGQISCTEIACACAPDKEWFRHYTTTSPETCALADFICPTNTRHFGNQCGCGCEQADTCPEWISCEPGNTSCESMRALCPYSQPAF